MKGQLQQTINTINEVTTEAKLLFGNLSKEQLNWKPSAEKWSIAQCLDHLIVSNSTYYPQLKVVNEGKYKASFYQNIGFLSKFFANYLIRETGAVVNKPQKNPPAFTPSQSEIAGSIVADFKNHQKEFSNCIQQLEKVNLDTTVISSPALSIITYSLKDLLIILAGHEQRHLAQAKNVLLHPDFPK